MPINIDQWCITTGLFYGKIDVVIPNKKNSCGCKMKILIFLFFFYGDIESNPGPKIKTKKPKFFSGCPWNVNSLSVQNKLSIPKVY